MAQLKSRTLILEATPGADYLDNPDLAALLASGWRITSSRPVPGNSRLEVVLLPGVELQIAAAPPEETTLWQGRPPFPGTLKQMPNKSANR